MSVIVLNDVSNVNWRKFADAEYNDISHINVIYRFAHDNHFKSRARDFTTRFVRRLVGRSVGRSHFTFIYDFIF